MSQPVEAMSQSAHYSFSLLLKAFIKKAKPRKKKMKLETNLSVNIALFKRNSIVDYISKSIPLTFVDQHAKIQKCLLNFETAEFNEDEVEEYTLRVYHSQGSFMPEQGPGIDELLIGQYIFTSNIYTDVFNEDKKSIFQEKAEISNQLILDYQMYVERSRELVQNLLADAAGCDENCLIFRNAFKKQIGRKRVKLIQINNSTECLLDQHQQVVISPRNICALKKIGNTYYPILKCNTGIKHDQYPENNVKPFKKGRSPSCKSVSSRNSKKSRKTMTNAETHYPINCSMLNEWNRHKFSTAHLFKQQNKTFSPGKTSTISLNPHLQEKSIQNNNKLSRLYKTMSFFIFLGLSALIFCSCMLPSAKI